MSKKIYYVYEVRIKDKVVYKTNNNYKCALYAANEVGGDWRDTEMYTNEKDTDFVHMKYDPNIKFEKIKESYRKGGNSNGKT